MSAEEQTAKSNRKHTTHSIQLFIIHLLLLSMWVSSIQSFCSDESECVFPHFYLFRSFLNSWIYYYYRQLAWNVEQKHVPRDMIHYCCTCTTVRMVYTGYFTLSNIKWLVVCTPIVSIGYFMSCTFSSNTACDQAGHTLSKIVTVSCRFFFGAIEHETIAFNCCVDCTVFGRSIRRKLYTVNNKS